MISKFNGTSTPKGSYSAKTGTKLSHESKQSPPEKNAMVKRVQSPRQDAKSHPEKSPIALTYSRIVEGVTESKRSFMFLTSKKRLRI